MTMTLDELKTVCSKAGHADFFKGGVIEALDFRLEVEPNADNMFIGSIAEYRGGYSRSYYLYQVNVETGRVETAGHYTTLIGAKGAIK